MDHVHPDETDPPESHPLTEGGTHPFNVLETLPVGVAAYGPDRRLLVSNTAFTELLGFDRTAYAPGSDFADHVRMAAHRGMFGPGDPAEQAAELTALDFSQPRRFRRRASNGRSYDSHHCPLPPGGLMICVVDVTAAATMREEAERAAARLNAIFSTLRIGIAAFDADRALALHNPLLAPLLGLPAADLTHATPFDAVLEAVQQHGGFTDDDGQAFLHDQAALDRTRPSSFRRVRANGTVLDIASDPLPDGGWTLSVADISPLARAEDEARRRAGLLDSILQQLPHGVIVYGPDRRIIMVNDAYQRIMAGSTAHVGDTQEALIRRRALAGEYGLGDPDALIAQFMIHDVRQTDARRRRRPNGSTIEIRTAPLPDGGHISVLSDVTDLLAAEAELELHASQMASIVSHIPHGVAVYGPDRRLRLVNPAYQRIMADAPISLGDTVDQIIERRAGAGEYGSGDPARIAEMQRGLARTVPHLRRRRRPDGSTIEVRTARLPDGGHISVVTDVTQLVEAEAGLERGAAEREAMLANIRHGIVLWDTDARIIAANSVAAALVDAPNDHFAPGRTLQNVVDDALARGNLGEGRVAEDRAARLLRQDRSISHLDQRLTRFGRLLEVRSDPTPAGGFVTTYTDVTQTRETEDALRLAKSAAEAANTAKSRFLAAMSGELRSPLGVIQNELSAIARIAGDAGSHPGVTLDPAAVAQGCATAAEAARRLSGLIESVLDVARLESGRFDLVDQMVEVAQLIRACLRRSDSEAAAGEVALVVDLPERLPGIRGDAARLRQALGHLIANAIRFTPAMGSVCIGARQEWTTGDLLLTVTDTGCGIGAAELERIFEPFANARANAQSQDGARAGIGLYIGRTLLRAHGGDLVLRSTPGEGTVATMRIPENRVVVDDQA